MSFLYTGKSNGILENCNCPKNKYGGLLNRLSFFKQNRDSIDFSIDSGDIFSFSNNDHENQIILDLLPRYEYINITPGELDLLMVPKLENLFVSQNIRYVKKENYFNTNGIRICITGAISPSFTKFDKDGVIDGSMSIEDISLYTKKLKLNCDLLIFLSHLELVEERKMFMENKEIDIMVSGHSGIRTYDAFDNRVYVSPGRNSEFVGKLELTMNKNSNNLYKISDHINKFYSMHIDSIPVDINAKVYVDSMKRKFNIKVNKIEINDYE